MQEAPKRLHQLEFAKADDLLQQNMEMIANTVAQMENDLAAKVNVPELQHKHKVIFKDGPVKPSSLECLADMKKAAEGLRAVDNGNTSLLDVYTDRKDEWEALWHRVDALATQLDDIPEKWRLYNSR